MTLQPPLATRGLALAVRAGGAQFRLDAQEAGEILRRPKLTRVPNAPNVLDGLANLRGTVLPVFSLARLLDLPGSTMEAKPFVLVMAGGAMGLAVDAVSTLRESGAELEAIRSLDLAKLARDHLSADAGTGRAARVHNASVEMRVAPAEGVALLGFDLAGQHYAFPLTQIDEVVATPATTTQLPTREAADLGVVLVRDALLPLVSLRSLLGLSPPPAGTSRHVVVVRLGRDRIGFAVDKLTSVRRARDEALSPVPSVLNRGGGEARISSIHRGSDGQLVSILSAENLFADPELAQRLADNGGDTPMQTEASDELCEQIVVFSLGAEEFGLPIAAVDEIARLPDVITRVPRAPAFVKGVMNLRGRVVPLIDQRARFGFKMDRHAPELTRQRVIVTQFNGLLAGFIVDEVRDILNLPASQIRIAPSLADTEPQTFDRVAMLEKEGRMILLVDPVELLNRAERDMLAQEAWTDKHPADA